MNDINYIERTLDNLLESEETWWAQRLRALWPQHGDKSTIFFFHHKASKRKSINCVDMIIHEHSEKFIGDDDIAHTFMHFIQDIFSSTKQNAL
jgi:hypothetical protein